MLSRLLAGVGCCQAGGLLRRVTMNERSAVSGTLAGIVTTTVLKTVPPSPCTVPTTVPAPRHNLVFWANGSQVARQGQLEEGEEFRPNKADGRALGELISSSATTTREGRTQLHLSEEPSGADERPGTSLSTRRSVDGPGLLKDPYSHWPRAMRDVARLR